MLHRYGARRQNRAALRSRSGCPESYSSTNQIHLSNELKTMKSHLHSSFLILEKSYKEPIQLENLFDGISRWVTVPPLPSSRTVNFIQTSTAQEVPTWLWWLQL